MLNAVRLTFYTMMMIALHTTDGGGAGINRVLREIQNTYTYTGKL